TIPIISFVVKSIRYDTPAECVSVQNASDKISSSLNPPKLPVVEKEAPKGKPPSTKDLDELIELSESESDRHTKKTTEIWEIDDVDSGHPQQSSKPANPIQISTQNPPNVDNLSSFKTIPAPPSSSIDVTHPNPKIDKSHPTISLNPSSLPTIQDIPLFPPTIPPPQSQLVLPTHPPKKDEKPLPLPLPTGHQEDTESPHKCSQMTSIEAKLFTSTRSQRHLPVQHELYSLAWSTKPEEMTLSDAKKKDLSIKKRLSPSKVIAHTPIIAVGGSDKAIHIVSLTQRKTIQVCIGHGQDVNSLEFHPEERALLASVSSDFSARLWNTDTGHCVAILQGIDGHRQHVLDLCWLPCPEMAGYVKNRSTYDKISSVIEDAQRKKDILRKKGKSQSKDSILMLKPSLERDGTIISKSSEFKKDLINPAASFQSPPQSPSQKSINSHSNPFRCDDPSMMYHSSSPPSSPSSSSPLPVDKESMELFTQIPVNPIAKVCKPTAKPIRCKKSSRSIIRPQPRSWNLVTCSMDNSCKVWDISDVWMRFCEAYDIGSQSAAARREYAASRTVPNIVKTLRPIIISSPLLTNFKSFDNFVDSCVRIGGCIVTRTAVSSMISVWGLCEGGKGKKFSSMLSSSNTDGLDVVNGELKRFFTSDFLRICHKNTNKTYWLRTDVNHRDGLMAAGDVKGMITLYDLWSAGALMKRKKQEKKDKTAISQHHVPPTPTTYDDDHHQDIAGKSYESTVPAQLISEQQPEQHPHQHCRKKSEEEESDAITSDDEEYVPPDEVDKADMFSIRVLKLDCMAPEERAEMDRRSVQRDKDRIRKEMARLASLGDDEPSTDSDDVAAKEIHVKRTVLTQEAEKANGKTKRIIEDDEELNMSVRSVSFSIDGNVLVCGLDSGHIVRFDRQSSLKEKLFVEKSMGYYQKDDHIVKEKEREFWLDLKKSWTKRK
ncbi:Polycomb protein EED like protein, partial [Aduncisulcus paluster]